MSESPKKNVKIKHRNFYFTLKVKSKIKRFPPGFCFQLTDDEFSNWRSQIVTSNEDKMITKPVSKQLPLDVKKFNEQYFEIEINKFKISHDRFLIIDDRTVYHFGASLKDLGKKWFAFSKMDIGAVEMLSRLGGVR